MYSLCIPVPLSQKETKHCRPQSRVALGQGPHAQSLAAKRVKGSGDENGNEKAKLGLLL